MRSRKYSKTPNFYFLKFKRFHTGYNLGNVFRMSCVSMGITGEFGTSASGNQEADDPKPQESENDISDINKF